MTTDLIATPDGPDPRQWHSDTRTGCLLLAGLFLFSVALYPLIHVCISAAVD